MSSRKSKDSKRKEELIKRAYVLGYEVGYYGHYEAVGWVRRELKKLEDMAKVENIENEVLRAYQRGKVDSARKRSLEVTEGREIPVDESQISIRAERTMIRFIRKYNRRAMFLSLPKFLKRRNHF